MKDDVVSLFKKVLKERNQDVEHLCSLYIIILLSALLFPISSKGIYLNFDNFLDDL